MADTRREFARRSDRIEELVNRIASGGDLVIRAVAQELVEAVIELHGVVLERILEAISDLPEGEAALRQIASDELVSSVLALHGIHPVGFEQRIALALEKSQSYLKSHGGSVELASVDDGVVHVRLQGACGTCSSSNETLKDAVESAIYEAAPEAIAVAAEPAVPAPNSDFVILQTS